jgi:hypothetical protein
METRASRRRDERRSGVWCGRYRRRSALRWIECRVIDVSSRGASIEVPGGVAIGDRIDVEFRVLGGAGVPVRLVALVRNGRLVSSGSCRLGIEFVDVTDTGREDLGTVLKQGFTSSALAQRG